MATRSHNITDLMMLGLPPLEYTAASYIYTQYDGSKARVTLQNIATILWASEATASRVMASLVAKGVLGRPQRGVYTIHTVNRQASPVQGSSEVDPSPVQGLAKVDSSPVQVSPVQPCTSDVSPQQPCTSDGKRVCQVATSHLSLVTSDRGVVIEPKGSITTPGAAPREMHTTNPESLAMIDYDEPDELAAIGLTQPRKVGTAQERKAQRRRRTQFHRLIPQSEWDPAIVAKEFGLRIYQARPELLASTDRVRLGSALRTWKKDHGLTVAQMILAMDQFFAEKGIIAGLTETPPAVNVFLKYLQTNFQHIKASNIDDAYIASLEGQMDYFKVPLRASL